MASNRKYAGLPDLDLAPDVYETPELTDDGSTHPAQSTVETEDYDSPDISRLRLDPDAARAQFSSTRVDARDADLSDRLDSKRRAYHVSQRRRRSSAEDLDGFDEVDDEDLPAPEGLRRKIARLQRQARELKAEAERLQQDKEVKAKDSEDHGDKMDRPIEQSTMEELNSAINDLESAGNIGSPVSASARLALRLGDAANLRPASSERTQSDSAKNTSVEHSPYTFTHQPSSSQSHALALAASLDSRLTAIETALGLSSLPLSTQSPESYPKPILPSIDILELKLRLLTSTTASSLEPVASRLRQMNYEAEALSEKRRTARLNYEEIRTSSSDIYAHQKEDSPSSRPRSGEDAPRRMATSLLGDPEVEAKINALYGTLPTIENVAPMLPNLVERLRSLRLMHQEAADAGIRLEDVETKARGMDEECKRWREGLERVENKISEGEDTIKKNTEAVDNWVKELEARVEALK